MRILWLDISASPWQEPLGWEIFKEYNFEFTMVSTVEEARAALKQNPVDLSVVNVDIPEAENFVTELKTEKKNPVIIISQKWNKKDFKKHSQSGHPADNYARLPMPANGFIDVVCAILKTKKSFLERTQIKISQELPESAVPPVPASSEPTKKPFNEFLMESVVNPIKETILENVLPPLPKFQNPGDSIILKKYLELKEQELEKTARDKENLETKYEQLDKELDELRKKFRELEVLRKDATEKSDRLEKKMHEQEKNFIEQKEKVGFEKESLLERLQYLESQLEESKEKYRSLKDRVRKDILKIQVREKELETRLELAKKDAQALLTERDRQVLELRRKIDTLEFDMDLIQDRRIEAEQNANKYIEKLSRIARTLHLAVGMVEAEEEEQQEVSKPIIMGGAAKKLLDPSAVHPPEISAVENLLKKSAQELNKNELEEAEAPTRIFNVPKEENALSGEDGSSKADQILADVLEEGGTQPTDAEDKIQTDVDKVAG